MSEVTRTFHLGKKAYVVALGDTEEVVLIGQTEHNIERGLCVLSLWYKKQRVGSTLDLENPDGLKQLDKYESTSRKFKDGDFVDFDSRRYIKSRYRDLIREVHNTTDIEARERLLTERHEEFVCEQRRNSPPQSQTETEETVTASIGTE